MKYRGTTLICTTVLAILLGINATTQNAMADTNDPTQADALTTEPDNKIDDTQHSDKYPGGDWNISIDQATPQNNYYVYENKDFLKNDEQANAAMQDISSLVGSQTSDPLVISHDTDLAANSAADDETDGEVEDPYVVIQQGLEDIESGKEEADSKNTLQAADYYQSVSDSMKSPDPDISNLQNDVQQVADLKDFQDFGDNFNDLTAKDVVLPFTIDWTQNDEDAKKKVLVFNTENSQLFQISSLDLSKNNQDQILAYYGGMSYLLNQLGYNDQEAHDILVNAHDFDHLLSETSNADPLNNSVLDLTSFYRQIGSLDLKKAISESYPDATQIMITNPNLFSKSGSIYSQANFEKMKDWIIVSTTINNFYHFGINGINNTSYLTGVTLDNISDFALQKTMDYFGDALSTYYGKKTFDQESINQVSDIINSIIKTYETRIKGNNWLSDSGKQEVLHKLSRIKERVGYPQKVASIGDYSSLDFDGVTDPYQIEDQIDAYQADESLKQFNDPNYQDPWAAKSYQSNAFYRATDNSFTVLASLATKPLFSKDNTASQNYGGIGVVIGHEISHAFDDNGSYYDAYGNADDIWSAKDRATFERLAQKMAAEYDGVPLLNHRVNGELTLNENIADNGGLNVALEAAKALPDFNADEFFSTWAKGWATSLNQANMDYSFLDEHTPSPLRTNIALQNIPDFYATYNISQKDKMWLDPGKRVNIW